MDISKLCCIIFIHFLPNIYCQQKTENPDGYLTTPQLIRRHGYPAESHTIKTPDGYLLEMHRIPKRSPRSPVAEDPRTVVLLQHGILSSSVDWVIAGPSESLAYLLSDAGYDVWMGNARGNTYSRAHVSLNPSDYDFWNFTWDEMAAFDLPTEIDHILEVTNQKEILYVGHSMGTTMFFALMASSPEYNAKVKFAIALAPVAFLTHMTSPIKYIAPWANDAEYIAHWLGIGQFLPNSKIMSYLTKLTCENDVTSKLLCANALFLIAGYDKAQLNMTLLPLVMQHSPAGTSTNTVLHYAQLINSGKFSKFDFGGDKNKLIYNSSTPPTYNLGAITTPVALFWGDNDLLVAPEDLAILISQLPSIIERYKVPLHGFNHVDFIYGIDAPKLVYKEIERLLMKMKNGNEIEFKARVFDLSEGTG